MYVRVSLSWGVSLGVCKVVKDKGFSTHVETAHFLKGMRHVSLSVLSQLMSDNRQTWYCCCCPCGATHIPYTGPLSDFHTPEIDFGILCRSDDVRSVYI